MNSVLLDLMRWASTTFRRKRIEKAIKLGDVSPESTKDSGLGLAYFICKLNPINFILGLISFAISLIPLDRRHEGEFTTGYKIVVTK